MAGREGDPQDDPSIINSGRRGAPALSALFSFPGREFMIRTTLCLLVGLLVTGTALAAPPKIAVTDLTYEEKVSQYFRVVAASSKSSVKASNRYREHDGYYHSSASGRSSLDAKSESKYLSVEGTYTYIDRGELHKFTSDIKGEMLRSGFYRVMQGKPYPTKDMEKIYDIIRRIKKGLYPGADYVLFGSVSSIQWRDEENPVQGTDKRTQTLSLELVADFNLINTRTFEIKAAFSAMGEGQDVKFLTGNNRVVLNRGKVVIEVSKSLGADVARQLEEQFSPGGGHAHYPPPDSRTMTETESVQRSEELTILH